MIERLPDPLERLPDPDPPPERAGSLQWVGMLSVAMVAIVADQVTKRLVSDRVGMDEVHQVLHQLISAQARHLSHDEICLIADALQTDEAVTIVYDNADGERTRRVIEPLNLDGHLLEAWCRLRDDERVFALARIRSVHPV